MARAYLWVGRIFTVCGEMIVPGVLGYWLDQSLGLGISVFAMIGFAVGLIGGMTHLVLMANSQVIRGDADGNRANREDPD